MLLASNKLIQINQVNLPRPLLINLGIKIDFTLFSCYNKIIVKYSNKLTKMVFGIQYKNGSEGMYNG